MNGGEWSGSCSGPELDGLRIMFELYVWVVFEDLGTLVGRLDFGVGVYGLWLCRSRAG